MTKLELERFNIQNYKLIAQYSQHYIWGGIIIMNNVGLKGRNLLSTSVDELYHHTLFEWCVAKFKTGNVGLCLIGVYIENANVIQKNF